MQKSARKLLTKGQCHLIRRNFSPGYDYTEKLISVFGHWNQREMKIGGNLACKRRRIRRLGVTMHFSGIISFVLEKVDT